MLYISWTQTHFMTMSYKKTEGQNLLVQSMQQLIPQVQIFVQNTYG